MTAADMSEAPPPSMPDYMSDPNAVLKDVNAAWRYGKPPDYSKTRTYYEETKIANHAPGSLEDLVQNLVKNWEVEASFKTNLSEYRTIDQDNYSFSINGGPPQSGEDMLKNGTYNAIIQPGNEYYCPRYSDFSSSHKTFKRMMPTFAWEVLEVLGAPPKVAVRWRHWGVMKNDYVGFNNKGEQITAKGHGGSIDIQGTTWATVNDKLQVTRLETWFDPVEMFRQIAKNGITNKGIIPSETQQQVADLSTSISNGATEEFHSAAATPNGATEGSHDSDHGSLSSDESFVKVVSESHKRQAEEDVEKLQEKSKAAEEVTPSLMPVRHQPESRIVSSGAMSIDEVEPASVPTASESEVAHMSGVVHMGIFNDSAAVGEDAMDISETAKGGYTPHAEVDGKDDTQTSGAPVGEVVPESQELSRGPKVTTGPINDALAVPADSEETKRTHEEMSVTTQAECPFMNKE